MTRHGLTFDTGALIALERRTQRAWEIYRTAIHDAVATTVPVAVIIEWWRGRTDVRERILAGVRVEPLHRGLAEAAGEALASARSASPVDAVVMASAASRGDVVYTSDVADCRFAASCSHLRADFRRVMQPPVLQPHAATSERG